MKLIGLKKLKRHWPQLKPNLRQTYIKSAYDFVVSR